MPEPEKKTEFQTPEPPVEGAPETPTPPVPPAQKPGEEPGGQPTVDPVVPPIGEPQPYKQTFDLDAPEPTGEKPPETPEAPEVPEEPETPTELTEVEKLLQQNQELSLKLLEKDPFAFDNEEDKQRLAGFGQPETPVESSPEEPDEPEEPEEDEYVTPISKFVDEDTYELMQQDVNVFNEQMGKIIGSMQEQLLSNVDSLIDNRTERYSKAQKLIEGYFEGNPELRQHKDHIELVARGIRQARPGLEPKTVLEEAGARVRKFVRSSRPTPGFTPPGASGAPRQKPSLTGFQQEAQDLFGG